MKRLAILAAALAAFAAPAHAADYAWPIVRVIDGDTIVVDASADMPAEIAELRVRLRGVDAPETGRRARCAAESARAAEAKTLVEGLLDTATVAVVRDPEWGKWGGRVVADIVLDGDFSLAEGLKASGLFHDTDSGRPAFDWCTMTATGPAAGDGADGDGGEDLGDFVDELLSDMDREEAATATAHAPADGAVDYHGEIERHLIDPCIEFALDAGMASPAERAALSDDGLARAVKARAAPMLAQFAAIMRPYVPHREWAFRAKVYDVYLEICKMELLRKHRSAAGG